jgi:ATP-dependent RNA helicase HelY
MSSPAERYAAATRRSKDERSGLKAFEQRYDFPLDDFQLTACRAVAAGRGVLVAAPTGAGKTVVGEFAVDLALSTGTKCFYTTPIKALSNQKFHDLVERYGAGSVGLLTGDNSINGEAPIVVMTTEVLRNMLYAGSPTLTGLTYVVMDEVHYLADRFRGAVWEEVIIHLPESVSVIALSATVSNAEEFGDWLTTVRGDTAVVVSETRPVPLWQYVMTHEQLYDLFIDDEQTVVNPELVRLALSEQHAQREEGRRPERGGRRRRRSRLEPSRVDEVHLLRRDGLLPAIVFIFSRAGCDAAVEQLVRAGVRLTDEREQRAIVEIVDERTAELPLEDLEALGWSAWRDALARGIASHHAGLLPAFKEVVEELFEQGLVKIVFATETLALGINMPARSVVLERLVKWNGDAHVDVTAGEYTQLTGRAGRRGIDVEGHAAVAWHQGLDPRSLAGLASTRTYPLNSSFRPSYNMAVNLVDRYGRDRARELLETSFAQFQADRAVVGLARQVQRNDNLMRDLTTSMACHLGDFSEYAAIRRRLSDLEADAARQGAASRRAQAVSSLERLKVGDIIVLPSGRRGTAAVVVESAPAAGLQGPRPQVVTIDRQVRRLTVVDVPRPVEPIGTLRVPRGFNARNAKARRDLSTALRDAVGREVRPNRARRNDGEREVDARITEARRELRRHPCHGCADREQHARWAERYWRLDKENRQLQHRIDQRAGSVSRMFDRVCEVLEDEGYLDGDTVTDAGRQLARLYTELDLVAADCLRRGLWSGLNPGQLAACVSSLVFESRQPDDASAPRLPSGPVADVLADMVRRWAHLEALERQHGVSFLREPDLGFAWAAHQWVNGARLQQVLEVCELTPGDFVRWTKQLVDLLDQISGAADEDLRRTARSAIERLRRGVVAYGSMA